MSFKKGALSNSDKQYIKDNLEIKSVSQIAEFLNRAESSIKNFIKNERLSEKFGEATSADIRARIRKNLRKKPFFATLGDVFAPKEIDAFVTMWIDFVEQFGEDVLATEEQELKKLFELEILGTRLLIEEKKLIDRRNIYEDNLSFILKLPLSEQDREETISLESRIHSISEDIDKKKKEFRELVAKQDSIRGKLYKKRSERTEDINKAKIDYTAQVKMLQDPEWRREAAMAMEIMATAAAQEERRMGEYFEFADKKLDQLLINSETVKRVQEPES